MQIRKQRACGGSPLTIRERSIIEIRWCRDGKTVTEIAKELVRHKSSISRELKDKPRCGVGKYNADVAHRKALKRIGKRGNIPKTTRNAGLKAYIEDTLLLGWSPEQISIRLPIAYKKDTTMRISYEAI